MTRLMRPTPSPPKTLFSIICAMGNESASGVSDECMPESTELVVAAVVVVSYVGSSDAEAKLLFSILPLPLKAVGLIDPSWKPKHRIASLFGTVDQSQEADEYHQEGAEERPALTTPKDHGTEGVQVRADGSTACSGYAACW